MTEMTEERRLALGRIATTAGLLSFWTIVLACAVAALGYQGARGEAYTPLNHWISELGQLGVSARASTFNLGLVAAGMEFLIFMLGMAMTTQSRLRWLFGAFGILAGLYSSGTDVFQILLHDQPAQLSHLLHDA